MKKFSISLKTSDVDYLDYVAKELDLARGELVRKALEHYVLKLKCTYGDNPYINAKFKREPQ